jgi:zinc transporter ZupT
MLLDRTITPHGDKGRRTEKLWQRGALGAGSLSAHSFLDGFAIGLAFKVSAAVGAIVSAAVLAHDFSDGINTVSIILRNKGDNRSAFGWLLIDAAAPVAGAASTLMLPFPQTALGLCLALFAGVFLYIGASDLLPPHKASAVDTRVCIDAARFPFEASSTAFRKALERGSGQCASDDGAAGAATLRISGTIRLATTKAIMIARKASA